jgi:hypothetical protein
MSSEHASRKNAHLEGIGPLIDKFFSSGTFSDIMSYAPIWNEWPSMVGENLAETVRPKFVQHGRLYVTISSHAMLHRVRLQKLVILDTINARLNGPKLTDIVFETSE